jgi:hypothetical protein
MNTAKSTKKTGQSQASCRCKSCDSCLDEARWERIFREKFADPSYYNRRDHRTSSPLVDL